MTESRTWQYRFDCDVTSHDDPNAYVREALSKGIASRKANYPVSFWAWTQELKSESGAPHIHVAVEYQESHSDEVRKGITKRMAQHLGLPLANKAQYSSGIWKDDIYWLGYMCKENLATFNGVPETFKLISPEECLKHYRSEKSKKKNVFKIKNKELIEEVAGKVKNNKNYALGKAYSFYAQMVIDEYFEECKRRKYVANYFQAKTECQKIIFRLSQTNDKIEKHLKNKLFEDI